MVGTKGLKYGQVPLYGGDKIELALALDDAAVEAENLIGAYLTYSSIVELRRQAGLLGQSVPPSSSLLKRARVIANASFQDETFSSRIWNNQEELKKRLFKGVRQSIIQGKNPLSWSNSLKDLLEDVGNLANYCTARIAITESARCQMEAQRQSYLENGYTQYMVICEPTACDICKKFDGVVQDVKDWVQGENAPAFHPFCKCSTTSYMDRRELEQSFAELEKAAGMPEEDRFQNIYDSVVRHRKDLIRNDLPEGFLMQAAESSGRAVQLLEETIKRLNARTDFPREIERAQKYSKNWPKADLDELVEAWGVDFSSAKMSENGKKIYLDTNREHVKIVVSPSGKYFRIRDDRFKYNNQNGYFDLLGDRGEKLREMIEREYGGGAERPDIDGLIKERTHFRYD